ncbi:autism susceptibility gene 2 protein homolog [Alligator sinensis]|uniref:Autism susceptibility gene 2 protein homolog n=1 Tax=Alligator sinensis TaxID=38654 RepID=A0A3Q0FQI8_ALLSI|nr:autism susceptibility gene 2 protein homolog [Alligator sinensis]
MQKDASLKTPERLEQRLKQSGKRKRGEGSGSEDGPGRAGSSEKGRGRRPGDRALRKPGKRRRKECDAESDPEEQASADELDQSFTVSASKGPGPGGAVNGTREAKLSVIPKVSGLERSQERSYEADRDALLVPFLPKEPLAFQFHQHNHQHQHTHQHTHQHFTPFPPGVVPAPAPAPAMFEKYPGKIDGLLRHNFYATFPSAMPGIPPVLPPTVSFGSLQGAFQPKSTNPELPSRLGTVAPSLSQKGAQLTDPFRPTLRKSGKWCAMHVRVAYMILRHQEKLKLMQGDPHKLDFRNDLITCLPGTGAFGTLAHGPELTRPATLFTPAGAVHPGSATHFGPPGAPPGAFLGPSAHIDPFSRPASFSALGALSNGAFGGLGNPTFSESGGRVMQIKPCLHHMGGALGVWLIGKGAVLVWVDALRSLGDCVGSGAYGVGLWWSGWSLWGSWRWGLRGRGVGLVSGGQNSFREWVGLVAGGQSLPESRRSFLR